MKTLKDLKNYLWNKFQYEMTELDIGYTPDKMTEDEFDSHCSWYDEYFEARAEAVAAEEARNELCKEALEREYRQNMHEENERWS